MILTTPQELRQYIPTHVIESLEPLHGFIDSSENDFLLERIGRPLYDKVCEQYEETFDKEDLLVGFSQLTPWQQLIMLCQRPVAFDMLYRAADVSALSVNASGINIVDTDGYDNADKDTIERYKKRLNTEAHRAIDRLLVTLEEWAQVTGGLDADAMDEAQAAQAEIVELWKKSRYYYLAEGLFINTASMFNEYVDIYDSREKFITLLPDLRYVSEFVLRPEIGDALYEDLLAKAASGANDTEKKAIRLIRYALALKVEDRNAMFKRAEAKDEAIGAMKRLLDYMASSQGDFEVEAVKSAPFYVEPKKEVTTEKPAEPRQPWQNNRRGNKLFVTRPIE